VSEASDSDEQRVRRRVENLLKDGAKPVYRLLARKKFCAPPARTARPNREGSRFVRRFACAARARVRKSHVSCGGSIPASRISPTVVTQRYEEHIAGRTYLIEVLPLADSRWRAQLVALPGMPTSFMPFYGSTPEQAVRQLSRWLSLVYNGTSGSSS
jgi:hypothetical protein